MTPVEDYIRQRLQKKRLLLMTHAIVGYPSFEANMAMLEAMQRADVDLVELQLPFQRADRRRSGVRARQPVRARSRRRLGQLLRVHAAGRRRV